MGFLTGIGYNLRGIWMGIRTPKLLFWGLFRFFWIMTLTIFSAGILFYYHEAVLSLLWAKPGSGYLLWLWQMVSWLLSMVSAGLAAVLAYLASQILFSVVIMEVMSQITERMLTGRSSGPPAAAVFSRLFFLIGQEIPRTILPVMLSLLLMVFGWLTPFGPVVAVFSAATTAIFLAWDYTDLVPARRLEPFGRRFRYLLKNLPFHLGFGLPFLVPGLNILSLAFGPVGATLYYFKEAPRVGITSPER